MITHKRHSELSLLGAMYIIYYRKEKKHMDSNVLLLVSCTTGKWVCDILRMKRKLLNRVINGGFFHALPRTHTLVHSLAQFVSLV